MKKDYRDICNHQWSFVEKLEYEAAVDEYKFVCPNCESIKIIKDNSR